MLCKGGKTRISPGQADGPASPLYEKLSEAFARGVQQLHGHDAAMRPARPPTSSCRLVTLTPLHKAVQLHSSAAAGGCRANLACKTGDTVGT